MILTLRNSIVSGLFIIALAATGWSILLSKRSPTFIDQTLAENHPDTYMENVTATTINDQGKPALKIETPVLTHYTQNNTTHLVKPKVTIFRESPNPWLIRSDYAEAAHGIEQIIFQDHVIIHHPSDTANPTTTMQTASLTVFPTKKLAQTGSAVTILQPDMTIHAIGMLANLNDGTVKLLSKARGEYVPAS